MRRRRAFAAAASPLSPLLSLLLLLFWCGSRPRSARAGSDQDLCDQIVRRASYPCESYTVTTQDGFLLGLHRIPYGYRGKGHENILSSRRPVYLQHGLLQAGDAWLLNSRKQSLAYILADEGFDVWIGSGRGTRWSHGHVSSSVVDEEFWDWSWDELAQYDIPAVLAFVYGTTGVKIFYVGHSQGTIIGFAALTQNTITSFVAAAALLSPISYLDHITSSFVNVAAHVYIEKLMKTMGVCKFDLYNEVGAKLMDRVCTSHRVDCGDLLASITGPNCCFNATRIPYYLTYEPHSTSLKNMAHLAQMIRDGTFAKYDYGILGNLKRYFRFSPPVYDLNQIPPSLPLWMAWGGNDALADAQDAARTSAELPSQPQMVYMERYGHIDFILSTRAKEDLYDNMIAFFRSKTAVAVS